MPNEIIQYAFAAGEIAPALYGRTDLTKYDLALAKAQNFIVDYRGGLSTRPGMEFCEFVKNDDQPVIFFDFNFSPDISNAYLVVFGDGYVRFLQDGSYVLNESGPIELLTNSITSTAHGLTSGRWVKIGGVPTLASQTFIATVIDENTFSIATFPGGIAEVIGGYAGGGTWYAVYEIASPYSGDDLALLRAEEYRDLLRLTHPSYPIRNLVRHSHTNWTIEDEIISPTERGPAVTSAVGFTTDTASANLVAQVVFGVTKVLSDGTESLIGNLYSLGNIENYTINEGSVKVNWSAQPDAVEYNVYRSVVSSGSVLDSGTQMGYVGRTHGTSFVDPNIIPDFTHTPPNRNNPFSPGGIDTITVTNPGTGYILFGTEVVANDSTGSGFYAVAVVDSDGAVVNIIIRDPGQGYTNPTFTFTGGGTGAEATATLRPLSGTYPRVSKIFQQRQIYAGSDFKPITIWGSQYKAFSNFNVSALASDSDSFDFDLDANAISPIRSALVTRGGLLIFTQDSVWLLNGGGNSDTPLTATQALADPQTYTGVSQLEPIHVGSDVLYVEGAGYTVRLLAYNEVSRVYGGDDKSLLSSHLFGNGKSITSWDYQESPYKIVWSVREDGVMLAFTIVQPQDVYAWTPCTTRGKFLYVRNVQENTAQTVYILTQRLINGRYTKMIERIAPREFVNVEDAWCVDAGLSLPANYPEGSISFTPTIATASEATFTSANLGNILRGANGIFTITSIISPTQAGIFMLQEPTAWVEESATQYTFSIPEGSWTMDAPVNQIGGLWHLEGETVSILGDGNVYNQRVVQNGSITLESPVTRCIVGLGFTPYAITLPLVLSQQVVEARRKRVVGLGVRLDRARGVLVGGHPDDLYPMQERTNELYGQPTALINDIEHVVVSSDWLHSAQTYLKITDPLPATILSLIIDAEIGDDPN